MNIFEIYLEKIKTLLIKQKSENKILLPENLNSINVEIPPKKFNCDLSTNVALILSKINNKSSIDLAAQLSEIIKNIDGIKNVSFKKPGFININLTNDFWCIFLKNLLSNPNEYGVNKNEQKKKLSN